MKKLFTFICAAALLASCSDSDDESKKYITVDFEDVPADILAVDKKGSNFYPGYDGTQYTQYTDKISGLQFGLNYSDWSNGYDFSAGGVVFSTFNEDRTTNFWENQCTVNYVDPKTGNGGYRGSKVFAIANEGASVSFTDGREHVIDHFWAMNTAYTTLVMENSNNLGNALSYENKDYFYVTITGYSAAGTKTGSVNYYLADFRTEDAPGILKEWAKVDMSSLGEVNKIEFSFGGSDMTSGWLNTPAYVCIDNIAVRK